MTSDLKLFVWKEHCPDYTDGLAIAIAHDEMEARKLIKEYHGHDLHDWGTLEVHELTSVIAFAVCGGG